MTPHLSLALLLVLAGPGPGPQARAVAPFVGEESFLVGHLDLSRPEVEPLARRLLDPAGEAKGGPAPPIARWLASLRRAGAKELFVVVDPADVPGPPIAVVPLGEGAD